MNLYIESKRALFTSELVYDIGNFIKSARKGDIEIKVPDDILPAGALEKFQNESIDFTQEGFGGEPGNGLPFRQFLKLLKANEDQLRKILPEDRAEFVESILFQIDEARRSATEEQGSNIDHDDTSGLFFSTYRSINQKVSCVYGVFKDKLTKRIIISFRGSQNPDFSTRDWRSNLNAKLAKMDTPALIANKMKGKLKQRILVHKGFYNYLFNNKYLKRENLKQRIDLIIDDVKRVLEEGYTIQVHGHSLGGALASMLAFELAGRDEDWIPKPVNCVTYASPFNGSSGFRDAFEQLEKDHLIRYLRVTNNKDLVPTVPPFSLGLRRRNMKHVGINLRLNKNGKPLITHSSNVGFTNAVRNSIFKPVWAVLTYHLLPFHETRLDAYKEMLTEKTIDGIYDDKKIVADDFNVVRA